MASEICAVVFTAAVFYGVGRIVGWCKGAEEAERVYRVGRYREANDGE